MSRYGRRIASGVVRPNIPSSFEYPKTNASFLSIRVTSTSSPSASDNTVASSRPPKPAPRTKTWLFIKRSYAFGGNPPRCESRRSSRRPKRPLGEHDNFGRLLVSIPTPVNRDAPNPEPSRLFQQRAPARPDVSKSAQSPIDTPRCLAPFGPVQHKKP